MRTAIAKWGNSLALRLPRAAVADANLYEGAIVDVRAEDDTLVVTSARPKYRLSDLLGQFRSRHKREEVKWGKARGEETW